MEVPGEWASKKRSEAEDVGLGARLGQKQWGNIRDPLSQVSPARLGCGGVQADANCLTPTSLILTKCLFQLGLSFPACSGPGSCPVEAGWLAVLMIFVCLLCLSRNLLCTQEIEGQGTVRWGQGSCF